MYVLHHADQPGLYHGLPKDPQISPMVSLWKGIAKPLGVAAMALTALAGFFHYARVGRNEVEMCIRDRNTTWSTDSVTTYWPA